MKLRADSLHLKFIPNALGSSRSFALIIQCLTRRNFL